MDMVMIHYYFPFIFFNDHRDIWWNTNGLLLL